MSLLLEALGMGFMQRALISGAAMAIGCALLGIFMVLRRQSMIGDGLAHLTFAGVGLGLMLGATPLIVALPLTVIASLIILRIPAHARLPGDTAIGMISAIGLAGGILFASIGGGFGADLNAYLFGDLLAITPGEAWLSVIASLGVVCLILLFRTDLFLLTFDPQHARINGIHTATLEKLIAVLVGIMVVLGMRVVGALLVSGLLVFPAASALQLAKNFRAALWLSTLLSLLGVLLGVLLAFLLDIPAAAAIILLHTAFFLLTLLSPRK